MKHIEALEAIMKKLTTVLKVLLIVAVAILLCIGLLLLKNLIINMH